MHSEPLSRRTFLAASAGLAAYATRAAGARRQPEMIKRTIPDEDEQLPVIGLGTWQTFDVGPTEAERAPLREVLKRFHALGGRVIDTSPMYARAEAVVGELTTELGINESLFLATKVWTQGESAGIHQIEASLYNLKRQRLDLVQVHNLLDVDTHFDTLEEWQERGLIRYRGITHYTASAYAEVEENLDEDDIEFVQINYSLLERQAELRILPEAADEEIGVIINRPFAGGAALDKVKGKPLPDWAAEFDCRTWPQFLLKFIIAHPAVTCVIPATSDLAHLEDNMAAGKGKLPDAAMRERMARYFDTV
jgi:diketogulonate reductase-like aldo/keto reductase